MADSGAASLKQLRVEATCRYIQSIIATLFWKSTEWQLLFLTEVLFVAQKSIAEIQAYCFVGLYGHVRAVYIQLDLV